MLNKPEYIIIHHSATTDGNNSNWEAIWKYHREVNKWDSIGYHYGLEEVEGKLYLRYGRPAWEEGAHAKGFNDSSIGICIVGNYDVSTLSLAKKEFLAKIVRAVQMVYAIPTHRVIGHRESYLLRQLPQEKSCPGSNIDMNELRQYIESYQYKEV